MNIKELGGLGRRVGLSPTYFPANLITSIPSISFNGFRRSNMPCSSMTVTVAMPVSSERLIDMPGTKSLIVFISSLRVYNPGGIIYFVPALLKSLAL